MTRLPLHGPAPATGGERIPLIVRTRSATEWTYNHAGTEEFELYDMRSDPYQLRNLYRTADPALLDSLRKRMATLVACRGASCRS